MFTHMLLSNPLQSIMARIHELTTQSPFNSPTNANGSILSPPTQTQTQTQTQIRAQSPAHTQSSTPTHAVSLPPSATSSATTPPASTATTTLSAPMGSVSVGTGMSARSLSFTNAKPITVEPYSVSFSSNVNQFSRYPLLLLCCCCWPYLRFL